MKIDFLYYEDCPSHEEALARLRQVLHQQQIEAKVNVIRVETEAQARELHFIGSPTIRIEGEDIDPVSPETSYALACRVYRKADGRITPLPPVELIHRALRAAVDRQ
jgi:hypothetical protein